MVMTASGAAPAPTEYSARPLARLHQVSKRHGAVQALDQVDLQVWPGEVVSLLGANGAGKSTAIALLLGLQRADAGQVHLADRSPDSRQARQAVGVMLQSAGLPGSLRVGELIALTRQAYARPLAVDECARLAGVGDLLTRRYARLSGGQQRRVQFALALCGRPALLFLDEPTTGLDTQARQQLWSTVRDLVAQGVGVLLTTHYLEEAEALADRVVVLDRGRVLAHGSVAQIRARAARRRISCVSSVSAQEAALWPGVVQARQQDGRLQVLAEAAEPVVRQLLAADPHLADLEVLRGGLADALVSIVPPQENV